MAGVLLNVLQRQHAIASKLVHYHLNALTTAECLWRPAALGLHVRKSADGEWRADWPDREDYDIGPASIAWLTWHIGFWWSMVLDHSFGDATLTRSDILWPGTAAATVRWINRLETRWLAQIASLDEPALASSARTSWPFRDRPFADVVAWVAIELAKNAAEIGYARFLYAVRAER